MNTLLTEVTRRVLDRWIAVLAVPGTLFLVGCAAAVAGGHAHAVDVGLFVRFANERAQSAVGQGSAGVVVSVVLIVVAGLMVGGIARAVATVVDAFWTADRPDEPPRGVPESLWRKAKSPTTRLRLRLDRHCSLDLATIWPELWLSLPDSDREQIVQARAGVRAHAATVAWGVLSLALGTVWWPAIPVGAVLILLGWRRGLAAATDFVRLVEAVVRLHSVPLAERLGLESSGRLTGHLGWKLTMYLQNPAMFELTERQSS